MKLKKMTVVIFPFLPRKLPPHTTLRTLPSSMMQVIAEVNHANLIPVLAHFFSQLQDEYSWSQ